MYKQEVAGTERVTTLGMMESPIRRVDVFDKWSPNEIGQFESSIAAYGKEFHALREVIQTKTIQEIVEFFYVWYVFLFV